MILVWSYNLPVFSTENENVTASYFTNGISGGHNYQAEQGRTAYCVDSDTTNSLGVTWDENEQCAVFDGQAYYVIENPLRGANANTGFTISMEAYISSGNNASCYYYGSKGNSKKANGNQRLFDLSNGTTKKYFFMNAGSAGHLRISLTTNGREHKSDMIMDSDKTYYDEWHIYTLVVAPGGNMTLYVDGELINHKVADSVVVNVLNELATYNTCYLGTSIYELTGSSDGFFIGKMRNVKFSVDNLIPPHDGSSCVYTGSSGLILNVPQNGSNKLVLNASPNGSSDLILNVPQSALSDLLLNPTQNSSNNLILNPTQKVSSSLILHTGTKKQYGDIVNYVSENGTTSAIVKGRGIIWLKEESIDHYDPVTGEPVITSSWYGLDNSSGTFEDGSVFWVRWINSDSDPEEWKKYYDMLDDEHKKWVENNKLWIFLTGVTGPDGKEYHILNANIPYYIQLGEDWDKNDIQALFISNNADEPIEYSYVDVEFPEGKGEFAKLILKHFSPYALYDKLQDNDFGKLLNESIFKDTGDTSFMMFYAYPLFCLVVLQRKKLLK